MSGKAAATDSEGLVPRTMCGVDSVLERGFRDFEDMGLSVRLEKGTVEEYTAFESTRNDYWPDQ